jgi:hypothetical protein
LATSAETQRLGTAPSMTWSRSLIETYLGLRF